MTFFRNVPMAIRDYRDLDVSNKAMDLVVECYRVAEAFPSHERYGLSSQLQRAAVSIPANIAEGRSRGRTKEFIHHLSIAAGSLAEIETHLEIAARLKYLDEPRKKGLFEETTVVGRMMNALQSSLRRKLDS
jgi:four helix bundle protein